MCGIDISQTFVVTRDVAVRRSGVIDDEEAGLAQPNAKKYSLLDVCDLISMLFALPDVIATNSRA